MKLFKQLFPTLLIPMIFLGAGCTQTASVDVEPVTEEVPAKEPVPVMFEDGSYALSEEDSSIVWGAHKRVGASHRGTVDAQEGTLVVEEGEIAGGTVVVEMSTITDLDLVDAERKSLLETHLKSGDFFAVEIYPTATFVLTQAPAVQGLADVTHRATGMMTIKGIEREITFPASIVETEGGIQVTGTAVLDRSLWNVRYGSDTFFDNLGDDLIEDEFTLTFDMLFTAEE